MGALLIGIVFMIIGAIVSARMKSKFKAYSQVHFSKDLSGAEVARKMLSDYGIHDVQVKSVEGELTDHYNPATKTVNLSAGVYEGRSVAATAVAAHECGHAVQHAQAYSMLTLRTAIVPIQNISARVLNFIFMAMIFGGFIFHNALPINTVLLVVIVCYAVFALFSLITLPVEFDASRRAMAWMKDTYALSHDANDMAQDALKWAAMTYVVAAIGAVVTLAYYVMIFLGGNRD
jgi:hypothetical protein